MEHVVYDLILYLLPLLLTAITLRMLWSTEYGPRSVNMKGVKYTYSEAGSMVKFQIEGNFGYPQILVLIEVY